MGDFHAQWVAWLIDGMSKAGPRAGDMLLRECGKRCAQTGTAQLYIMLFESAGRDMNCFFARLDEIRGVRGAVITPGKVYEIIFTACLCDLHTEGRVNSDILCACSQGSVEYIMHTLAPDSNVRVERFGTILGGASECVFRVTLD